VIEDPVRFPSGMKALGEFIRERGMKYGGYTSASETTCQNRPGSYQHEVMDAQTYCDWKLDFLKIDICGGDHYPGLNTSWLMFRKALDECTTREGRPPVHLACSSCGPKNPDGCHSWIRDVCNQWRTVVDIQATWDSLFEVLETNDLMRFLGGNGKWNDADMLQVGNVGLSHTEQISHFSLWCLLAAPLLISTDLRHISNETVAILTAPEPIAVAQDLLGVQGTRITPRAVDGPEVWAKPIVDGFGVVLLNRGLAPASVTLRFEDLGWPQGTRATIRDLWTRSNVGEFLDSYTVSNVPSHGSEMVTVKRI
jgi:alpha-galactosidase